MNSLFAQYSEKYCLNTEPCKFVYWCNVLKPNFA